MLILDYLRFSKENEFPIAPFHSGHLGLFPGSEVSVSLQRSQNHEDPCCEVLVTPFIEQPINLCRVHCVLKDQIGVIRRLLEAIYGLGLNIVTLESSVMNCKTQHHCYIMADWGSSPHNNYRETPRKIRNAYRRVAHRIPIHDWRYILLYESIMHSCGDIIGMDEALRFPAPSIQISPFRPSEAHANQRQKVHRNAQTNPPNQTDDSSTANNQKRGSRFSTALNIDPSIAKEIRRDARYESARTATPQLDENESTEAAEEQPVDADATPDSEGVPGATQDDSDSRPEEKISLLACMVSETSEKTLRMFFPNKEAEHRLYHLGFEHENIPGAVHGITQLLEKAGFNILTGVLRKTTAGRSRYDVLLEHRQHECQWLHRKVKRRDYDSMLNTCFDLLKPHIESVSQIERYRISLAAPKFPEPHTPVNQIDLEDDCGKQQAAGPDQRTPGETGSVDIVRDRDTVTENLTIALEGLREPEVGLKAGRLKRQQIKFLNTVKERNDQRQPTMFLSYPHYAKLHADLLKKAVGRPSNDEIERQILHAGRDLGSETNGRYFGIDEYQDADYSEIKRKVVDKIEAADFFLGIWHHEPTSGHSGKTVSPWMPFEYGIAEAREKPCIILYSDELPNEIKRRIDLGTATESYKDLEFLDKVKKIRRIMYEEWYPKWEKSWVMLADVLESVRPLDDEKE